MAIKSKVFIQTLQKSQDRHKISFAFEFNNKNTKKVFGANLPPPPIQLSWIYPPTQLGLTVLLDRVEVTQIRIQIRPSKKNGIRI